VPGLQKLGQVIARNQHLRPALRDALARLENGIRDVKAQEIREIIQRDLGERVKTYDVRVERKILSEASVSAVLRFTWRDPESGRRARAAPDSVLMFVEDHGPDGRTRDQSDECSGSLSGFTTSACGGAVGRSAGGLSSTFVAGGRDLPWRSACGKSSL